MRFSTVVAAFALAALAITVTAPLGVAADVPWWQPVALSGVTVRAVEATGSTILVRTGDGRTLRSADAGKSFTPVPGNPSVGLGGSVTSGPDRWVIDGAGRVLHATASTPLRQDPHAPALGPGARLIAAPAAAPGVVIAVATDGTVWRRAQDGGWARALLLLPAGFPRGVPAITDVSAFTQPLSFTVYLSTDGYAVLNSTDGGDDWFRAGPGLPDSVFAVAADDGAHAVYAGTSDGLWVHRLRAVPAPPVYRDAALGGRIAGTAAVTLLAAVGGLVALRRLLAAPRR